MYGYAHHLKICKLQASFSCESRGKPAPTLFWMFDGMEVEGETVEDGDDAKSTVTLDLERKHLGSVLLCKGKLRVMWIRRDGVRFSGLISVGAVCPHLPILYDPIMKSLHNLNTARAQCRTQCSDDLEGADLM